jgi:hypothetical protein
MREGYQVLQRKETRLEEAITNINQVIIIDETQK